MKKWKDRYKRAADFFAGIGEHRIPAYAAAGAYYLFMSLVPIVVIICSLLPYTPLTQDTLLRVLNEYVPNSLYDLLAGIVDYVYEGSAAVLSVSIILTIWAASSAIAALMRGMDTAYDAVRKENYLVFRLKGYIYVLILIAATLVSLCAMVYGAKILELIRADIRETWLINAMFIIVKYGRYLVVVIVLVLIFGLLYKWIPAKKLRLRDQWYGAVFTAVAWAVFSAVFSVYVSVSNKYGIYGFLGTIMVAMLWMFYCMFFLLIGAYINRYIEIKRASSSKEE